MLQFNNDLERIAFIEETFGFKLTQCPIEEIGIKDFYTASPLRFHLSYLLHPAFPYKGARKYSLDKNYRLIGLSLDYCPITLLPNDFINGFSSLNILSLQSSYTTDYSFLAKLTSLTSLDLRSNHITDISILKELTSLTSLDLRYNQITDISILKELTSLTRLDLSFNQITDISIFKELTYLTRLDLCSNKITNISVLKGFKSLIRLDLGSNKITDLSILKGLKTLTSLNLSSNKITDLSILKELTSLTSLYLSSNQITDISILKELTSLTSLYLSSNKITDLSILKELKSLTSLDLGFNQITDISILKELTSLTSLDLSYNKITDLSILKELKSLTSLDLGFNQITDISIVKELTSLTSLDLSYNKITDISILNELISLTSLDLNSNQITSISILKELTSLTRLNLSSNQITNISILRELTFLTSLDLSSNQITDISILKELKSLTSLDLSSNQITDISILKELKSLTSLDLSSNKITDISILRELKSLTSLDLSSNKITDISILSELTYLTRLKLSLNQITDLSILKGLTSLTLLYLWNNKITDISILKELTSLTHLDLRNNQIVDISILKEFKSLTNLDLQNNQIRDISILKELKFLISLDLSDNQIINISILKELTSLIHLDLRNNRIGDISILKELTSLTSLDLRNNLITDISILKELTSLTSLDLRNNLITDISILKELKSLTSLDLSSNKITDISILKELKSLTSLDLSSNKITDISILKELKSLTYLYLSYNKITDISILKELKSLTGLDLSLNKITDISILKELKSLTYIKVDNNPITIPPLEVAEGGIDSIRSYFKQIEEQQSDSIYEAKMMILGEPGSGKSTLTRKLFDRDYPVPDPALVSTTGIDVRRNWPFAVDQTRQFNGHIWDFGGQQIQYTLHQFFLTESALYILMADTRKELFNLDYWFNILHILANKSPVLLLFNEINIDAASPFVFDEKKYRYLFPEMNFQRLNIDLAKIEDGRFDFLLNKIKDELPKLPHVGQQVPAKWKIIRQELDNLKDEKLMRIEDYFKLCREHTIAEQIDQLTLLNYFHLLGIVLYFKDDPDLKDTIFLDPNWTVNAVYTILADKAIEQYNGKIPYSFMEELWNKQKFSFTEQTRILNLMLKDAFELCYPCKTQRNHYIIPMLLSKTAPLYDWDDEDNLFFRFQYPFMPRGITNRLMVRLNELIEDNIVWQEGVIFAHEEARALVIEKQTTREGLKIIEITLKGRADKRKELLTLVRQEIKDIQSSSFPNLPYFEMIPCNCDECRTAIDKEYYAYSKLKKLLYEKQSKSIQCHSSSSLVDIRTLIDEVIDERPVKRPASSSKAEESFDVFLCHNSKDKETIKDIGLKLKQVNLRPWLDVWNLRPGDIWQKELEKQINRIKVAAVFIGPDGVGPWEDMEIMGFLKKMVEKQCRIIPVILAGCPKEPEVPLFLHALSWVDFRKSSPEPFGQLVWGITGEKE